MKLTPEQAAIALAADRHVLVSAGAGTGKTRTVVARVLYLLGCEVEGSVTPEPLPLRRLAAITFTNRAAADLQEKLRESLRQAGRRRIAWEVDTARIGTIHRFCGEILREFALRRGRPPVGEVLEEGVAAALASEVAREALLDALDADTIPGLGALLSEHAVSRVLEYTAGLVAESDRLQKLEPAPAGDAGGQALLALARDAVGRLISRLEERGAVDFDRMILWTRDLLRDDAQARRTLQRRIHTLIVDEFQDVDPVQREIAYLLGEPGTRRADTTRLLLVGDAKQSIYRFRRADVTVWRAVERDFREQGTGLVLPLTENFRSSDSILGFVEGTLGRLLDQPLEGETLRDFEVPFEPLHPGTPEQHDGAPVELLTIPPDDEGNAPRTEDIRRIEADAVARRARELHDREGVRWGDMALLFSSWGAVDLFQSALRRVGAHTYLLRTEGFFQRREIVDLIVALEAVRDPADDRAVMGFLRSPFVGLRDETLLDIARQARAPVWPRLGGVTVGEAGRLQWGIALLERFTGLRDRLPPDELLQALLDHSGYVGHLALLGDDRAQAIANVRKFVRMARGARQGGLGEFLQAISDMRGRHDRVGDAPLHGDRDDVVTLTSIHSAKGLEWDTVFWCDLTRQVGAASWQDMLVGRERIALKSPEVKARAAPEEWRGILHDIEEEEQAEARRLWYVAATRARRRLILSGLALGKRRGGGTDPSRQLLSVLPSAPWRDGQVLTLPAGSGSCRILVCLAASLPAEMERSEEAAPIGDPESLPGPLVPVTGPVGRRRHSASEFLVWSRCPRRHWFRYVQGVREPEVNRNAPEFLDAVTRGLIVHDVLEHLRAEDELDQLLEDAIGRWDEDHPPPDSPQGKASRRMLREEIVLVADNPAYRAVDDLAGRRRELSYVRLNGPATVFQGAIDLAAPEGDHLVLLDVKTSRCDAEAAPRRAREYAPQRDVYVTAVEALAGLPVGRFAFQFSRAGVQVSEDLTDDARAAMAVRVGSWLERLEAEAPALTDHPHECRFCGYRREGWCPGVAREDENTA